MDKFTEAMLANTGLLGMIGKAERGQEAIDAIKKTPSRYLMAVGGAAYLVSKAIRKSRIVAFADLGIGRRFMNLLLRICPLRLRWIPRRIHTSNSAKNLAEEHRQDTCN